MIKLTCFCGVKTVILSDPVLIIESFDSSFSILGRMPIKVGMCSVMVSSQLMNNIYKTIYLKNKQLWSCESPGTFQGQCISGGIFWEVTLGLTWGLSDQNTSKWRWTRMLLHISRGASLQQQQRSNNLGWRCYAWCISINLGSFCLW